MMQPTLHSYILGSLDEGGHFIYAFHVVSACSKFWIYSLSDKQETVLRDSL
jgi:hypothetical protein